MIRDTALVISDPNSEGLVGTLTREDLCAMENALQTLLEEEMGSLVPCSTFEWFQIGGPPLRPSLTVQRHGADKWRLLWARQFGYLHDLVITESVLADVWWLLSQWVTEIRAPAPKLHTLAASLPEAQFRHYWLNEWGDVGRLLDGEQVEAVFSWQLAPTDR